MVTIMYLVGYILYVSTLYHLVHEDVPFMVFNNVPCVGTFCM
jgi:hypothetical protein